MRRVLAGLLLFAGASFPGVVRADTITACASAAESAQRAQRAGKLVEARASLLVCAEPECPREVVALCDRLLTDVDTAMPTVVLSARDPAGHDLSAVHVLADGAPFAASIDGKPRSIDPGPHNLRFVGADGASSTLDVVVREGEKNRVLSVVLGRPKPAPTVAGETPRSRRPPVLGWVLGGVGLAALATFGVLAVHGQSQYDACSPHKCSASTVDSLSLERGAAFVALGIGVAGLATGGWLVLSAQF